MKMMWKMAGFRGSRPFLDGKSRTDKADSLRHAICRSTIRFLVGFAVIFFLTLLPAEKVHAEPVKIVIDPGHGGKNLGAEYGIYTEKYMTMVVANAMAEELRKYEDVEVYLTRTEDTELSLQQRADYAKEVDADFLFCLHFNMSENHTLYGTEVWVSAFGNCYAEGKSFADLCLNELCTLDLYSRGVKTRLNKDGIDYYGIIQHCEEYKIPAAIIEHCHLDHKEDAGRYETTEAMERLGVLDATAVAKYYGLYSPTLGVDYRRYEKPKVEVPTTVMKPDDTEPVNVSLTCLRRKEETGEVNILLTGEDPESGLLYYDYSLNGGETYSGLQKWETNNGELECTLKVPVDQDIALKCRIYNGYDLGAETETIEIPALQGKTEETAENIPQETSVSGQETETGGMVETSGSVRQIDMSRYESQDAEKDNVLINSDDLSRFLWLAILGLLVSILILLMITRAVYRKKQRKARYKGRRR